MNNEAATAKQITYINSMAHILDLDYDHPDAQRQIKLSAESVYAHNRGCETRGVEPRFAYGIEIDPTARRSVSKQPFVDAFIEAANADRVARHAEARELVARLDSLTKAEASHLIDLLNPQR